MVEHVFKPNSKEKMYEASGGQQASAQQPHLHPGLVVQVRDVELLTWGMGEELVVLFHNLVNALRGQTARSVEQAGELCVKVPATS